MANVPDSGRPLGTTWFVAWIIGGLALTVLAGCLSDYYFGAFWTQYSFRPPGSGLGPMLFHSIPYLPWAMLAYAIVGARVFRRRGFPAVAWAVLFGTCPFLLYTASGIGTM